MQLSDVALVDDKLPEHVMQYQRLPATVLTEERLASVLSHETKKLNLEHGIQIPNSFIGKISNVAPNIENLSLRRMPKLEEQFFCTLFSGFERLLSVDLSGCIGLQPNSLQLMLNNNANLIHLQLSGCPDAINEVSMKGISNLKKL